MVQKPIQMKSATSTAARAGGISDMCHTWQIIISVSLGFPVGASSWVDDVEAHATLCRIR